MITTPAMRSRAALVAFAVLLAGCGDDDATADGSMPDGARPDGDGGPPMPMNVEVLFDTTRVLTDSSAITRVEDQEVELDPAPAELGEIAVGDVLLAGPGEEAPDGLLRVVTAVDRTGGTLTLTTSPATLFHAYRRLAIHVIVPLTENAPTLPPSMQTVAPTVVPTVPVIGGDLEPLVIDDDDDPMTTDDRLQIGGRSTSELSVKLDLEFDWGTTSPADARTMIGDGDEELIGISTALAMQVRLQLAIVLSTNTRGAIDVEGVASRMFDRSLVSSGAAPPAFRIGTVVVAPHVQLETSAMGGTTRDAGFSFVQTSTFGAGALYHFQQGFQGFRNGPGLFSQMPGEDPATPDAPIDVDVDLHLALTFFGGSFVDCGLVTTSAITTDRARTPCHELKAGFEARPGFGPETGTPFTQLVPIDERLVSSGACFE